MKDWTDILIQTGALWMHNGSKDVPHALLASGKHSNGYSNGTKIIGNPKLLAEVVEAMRALIADELTKNPPQYVVGPAMGAIAIGYEMARQLGTGFIFTEPKETPEGKIQELKRFDIPKEARVLLVEDMVTTGGSIQQTVNAIEKAGGIVLPVIPIILDRSQGKSLVIQNQRIVPLITLKTIDSWDSAECPLCAMGSMPLAPKANWEKFV